MNPEQQNSVYLLAQKAPETPAYLGFQSMIVEQTISTFIIDALPQHADWQLNRLASGLRTASYQKFETLEAARAEAAEHDREHLRYRSLRDGSSSPQYGTLCARCGRPITDDQPGREYAVEHEYRYLVAMQLHDKCAAEGVDRDEYRIFEKGGDA